jgi:folate-dependent phosphoribosylglycinamide formyltransferase PurN
MSSTNLSVVVLTTHAKTNYALIEALARDHHVSGIVFERQTRLRIRLFLNRLRKLGIVTVFDQAAYKILDLFVFRPRASQKMESVLPPCLSQEFLAQTELVNVSSINSPMVTDFIVRTKPETVVVSGTSLLGTRVLQSLDGVPIVNIHCGITPRYRGAHGAFWAVVNEDWDNVGTTVHLIDAGIDTGGILFQERIRIEPNDDPRDLALKQHLVGIRLACKAVSAIAENNVKIVHRPDLDSRFYSSPTLSSYRTYLKKLDRRFG